MILIIIYSIYNLFLILQKFDLRNLTIIQSHHHRITRLTVHHRIAQYRLTAKEFRSGWDKLKTSVRAPKIEGRTRQKGGGEKKKGKRKKKKKESSSLRAQRGENGKSGEWNRFSGGGEWNYAVVALRLMRDGEKLRNKRVARRGGGWKLIPNPPPKRESSGA